LVDGRGICAIPRSRIVTGDGISCARAGRQFLDCCHRGYIGDTLLVAALQECIAAVDHEARDTQERDEHEDAEHERLAILPTSQFMQAARQLSTLAVRRVVRFPEATPDTSAISTVA
jgi:hypothetical protein